MKRLLKKSFIFLTLLLLALFSGACNGKNVESGGSSESGESGNGSGDTSYTVTFVCEGYDDIVYTVNRGDVLTDVPDLPTIDGYVLSWQGYDLTKPITSSVTVTAVKTPNKYTVTFQLELKSAVIEPKEITATYGENYILPTPTCTGYKFVGWKTADGKTFEIKGIYALCADVELIAEWEIDEGSSENWSDGH